MITENIMKIKNLRKEKELITQEMNEQTRPIKTNLDEIPSILEKLRKVANQKYKDNIKIFVFIVVYMYSPKSCLYEIDKRIRMGVRRRIAKQLCMSSSNVSLLFGDAKVLFEKHCGFKAETERVYALLLSE